MSPQAPKVLSRQANGILPNPASQLSESGKGKGSHENHAPSKPGRGRGSGGKSGDANKNATEGDAPKPAKTKPHNEGEKLVIRRLPPGMTQTEFTSILGSEWDVGKGRVDWFSYAPGKISNDPSKPSRPGRAYVHVMRKDDIMALSDSVRTSTWEDAKATFNNPSLIGPPAVEFAIYKKVPSTKKRSDARQGTIDQDPEFMAFLEDLANPAPPRENIDADDADDVAKAEAKVTTTPLIEYLKEKKANKAKDAAASKNSKGESRGGKGKGVSKDDESIKKKSKESKESKIDKALKETVKILTKKATTEQAGTTTKTATTWAKDSNNQEVPKSRRAGIAAAARILQRDLGLSPGSAHRKARQDAAKGETDTKPPPNKEPPTPATTDRQISPARPADVPAPTPAPAPAPASGSAPKNRSTSASASKTQPSGRRTRGGKTSEKSNKATEGGAAPTPGTTNPPVILLKKKGADTESSRPSTPNATAQVANQASSSKGASTTASNPKGSTTKSGSSQKKPATVTPDAVRGFVKHANPSQGVTEALLKQTLEVFGTITFVEIDKRKGFAYVDFSEHEGLVKAVTASPITVAQGTVQVLERKDKKPANTPPVSGASGSNAPEKASGRGRRGRGGGGKGNATSSSQTGTLAASTGG
ncbi:hypothetical protein QQZ08_005940 [Neonectria magnoliae]|uniref:RRM domain-containing protein n=1 Tax=Neonectria magnoliae TaxID=2732573 RepID=A0ABR1I2L8_9HYPO